MKRLPLLAILCLLLPATAGADDGWWDFLWRMHPKFNGPNADLHLCWNEDGTFKPCEGFFGIPAIFGKRVTRLSPLEVKQIRHELSLRVGYYFTYSDSNENTADPDDLKGLKLQAFYHYRFAPWVSAGAGVGWFPLWGDGVPTDRSEVIFTPVSVVLTGPKGIFFRFEITRIDGLKLPGETPSAFSARGEWNPTFGFGFDFRRW